MHPPLSIGGYERKINLPVQRLQGIVLGQVRTCSRPSGKNQVERECFTLPLTCVYNPCAFEKMAKDEVKELVDIDVLEKSVCTASCSPSFFPREKKDGGIRSISDLRKINRMFQRKPYLLPNIVDVIWKMNRFTYATCLNLNQGYYYFVIEAYFLCVPLCQIKHNQREEAFNYHSICLILSRKIKNKQHLAAQGEDSEETTEEISPDLCDGLARILSLLHGCIANNFLSLSMARKCSHTTLLVSHLSILCNRQRVLMI